MDGFIDDHREEYGVEPICKLLPLSLHLVPLVRSGRKDSHRTGKGFGGNASRLNGAGACITDKELSLGVSAC
jgi:hypothetical protein